MAEIELFSEDDSVENVLLKVKSLVTLLSEIKESSGNYELDQSIFNDIHTYIQIIQSDCKRIKDNYNLFSNRTVKNIYDNKLMTKSIQIVNKNEHFNEKLDKFDHEIDFHVDGIIKFIQITANILNSYHKESSFLNEETNNTYRKLISQNSLLSVEINKFNKTDIKIKNAVTKWKEKLKHNNDLNELLAIKAQTLVLKYQQKMLMVKNNVMNIALSMSKMLSMKAKYLKLEIRIIWEGDSILKMYKNINKLIEMNEHKLNCYNDLQSQMDNINKNIIIDLYNITHANLKAIHRISNQIGIHNGVKKITEEKLSHLRILNNKIYVNEEQLVNSQAYLKNIEHKTVENQNEITIKRQQIEDGNIDIEGLKENIDNKNKHILALQHLIGEKQSQLKDIELKHEKDSNELEAKKSELQKKENNLKTMNLIASHYKKETEEKKQFYLNNIVQPLDIKLEKSMALVDYEKMRNKEISTKSIELNPHLKKKIENAKSQIKQMDETLSAQYEIIKKLEYNFKNVQFNVLHQLDISTNENEKLMNIFHTIINYKIKMINNLKIKQKSTLLECELFQKRYEINKKREKFKEKENLMTLQFNELKKLVRHQAIYNKELSKQYIQMKK